LNLDALVMMLGNAEIDVIQKRTWGLVLFLKEKAIIGVKWIFRTKYNANRSISKCEVGGL